MPDGRGRPKGCLDPAIEVASHSRIEAASLARALRLVLDDRRIFVDFREFPWFRGRTREELQNVERPFPDELRWPALDVDLAVDSLLHPERYPLRFDGA